MDAPLLSICIPTFNRADCLRQCLESIVSQFSDPQVSGRVEVVVSDNHSTDDTLALVQEFKAKYQNIVYKQNTANFGVDRNILQVVEMSHGKFVWLLGDDDAFFENALAYLLKLLEQPKADYYIANCWGYNKSLTDKALNKPNLFISEDQNFSRLSEYVRSAPKDKSLVGLFCGLSIQIFLKQPWMELENKEQYIGTNAVHLHTLLTVFKDRAFCLLSKPLVKVRADNIRWEVFEGLETLNKRTWLTQKGLEWILKEYKIPYSVLKLKTIFIKDLIFDWMRLAVRKHILKSQKSRDVLKKFLGKL